MSRHAKRTACAFCAFFACCLCLCALGLVSCGQQGDTREAGRVFDRVFTEQEVIDYVAAYREGSATTDDADWAAWLAKKGTTAEKLRTETLNYLAENFLVERAAQLRDVEVSDDEVQEALDEQKSEYTSELAWTRALINSGYTEDAYKMSVKSTLLKAKIKETFADPSTVSDADLQSYANNKVRGVTIKRSSAIFVEAPKGQGGRLEAQANAQKAHDELVAGAKFADVFSRYSDTTYAQDGDMGYDMFWVPTMSYRSAVNALHEEGDISDVVESDEGYFVVVCTEVFTRNEGKDMKLSKFPKDMLDKFREEMAANMSNEEYNEFYTKAVSEAQVAIEPMPQDLPYNVEPADEGGEAG